ncbi:BQ2448_4526 [Microbotryum intermedium]|uniref:BQ2448_4526 protein n=1 Tax=Microbotryum intermedium TaxID=269621 RepID=A0A238FDC6_9BASI|nr:BQ2448_4526 [Microbotryum intermedium]
MSSMGDLDSPNGSSHRLFLKDSSGYNSWASRAFMNLRADGSWEVILQSVDCLVTSYKASLVSQSAQPASASSTSPATSGLSGLSDESPSTRASSTSLSAVQIADLVFTYRERVETKNAIACKFLINVSKRSLIPKRDTIMVLARLSTVPAELKAMIVDTVLEVDADFHYMPIWSEWYQSQMELGQPITRLDALTPISSFPSESGLIANDHGDYDEDYPYYDHGDGLDDDHGHRHDDDSNDDLTARAQRSKSLGEDEARELVEWEDEEWNGDDEFRSPTMFSLSLVNKEFSALAAHYIWKFRSLESLTLTEAFVWRVGYTKRDLASLYYDQILPRRGQHVNFFLCNPNNPFLSPDTEIWSWAAATTSIWSDTDEHCEDDDEPGDIGDYEGEMSNCDSAIGLGGPSSVTKPMAESAPINVEAELILDAIEAARICPRNCRYSISGQGQEAILQLMAIILHKVPHLIGLDCFLTDHNLRTERACDRRRVPKFHSIPRAMIEPGGIGHQITCLSIVSVKASRISGLELVQFLRAFPNVRKLWLGPSAYRFGRQVPDGPWSCHLRTLLNRVSDNIDFIRVRQFVESSSATLCELELTDLGTSFAPYWPQPAGRDARTSDDASVPHNLQRPWSLPKLASLSLSTKLPPTILEIFSDCPIRKFSTRQVGNLGRHHLEAFMTAHEETLDEVRLLNLLAGV